MEPLKIIDIIDHRNKNFTQRFLVTNRKPQYLYERKGIWLIGEDSGFFNFYYYEKPCSMFKAFAGREFEIPMKDGEAIKATGQWWHGVPVDYRGLLIETGYGTPDSLAKCNVFRSVAVNADLIDTWLVENKPSNNYHKYDERNSDYGKHTIKSRWEGEAS